MGLTAGLVIMITCLTGAILVFEKELQHIFFKERYYVKETGIRISADSLINIAGSRMPSAKVTGIKLYRDPSRTAEVTLKLAPVKHIKKPELNSKKEKNTAPDEIRITAFINPYNGIVIKCYNYRNSFFYFVMDLHRWMLGGDTGKWIVGTCTLIFLFILITGIILWWPKNKAILKQRLKIKSSAGFKRLNHDYHIVLGFYSAIFLFVFAFTGLAWSFQWFIKGIFTVTGTSMEKTKPAVNKPPFNDKKISVETALQIVLSKAPDVMFYQLNLPKDSVATFSINVLSTNAPHESASDTYFVDTYSGNINSIQLFSEKNQGQRIRATFKPVHVSSIFGMPSKIVGFLACLLGAFFPLSGIIMWLNRTRKKKPLAK